MSENDKQSLVNQMPPDDGIPFGGSEATQIPKATRDPNEIAAPDKFKLPSRADSQRIQDSLSLPERQQYIGTSQQAVLRREIFIAILQGFAVRGELSRRQPGSTLGVVSDAEVQGICRHAAGVASFAAEAARASNI